MSPEQAEGRLGALGPATDVYSLGATLYCLLTGRAPVPEGPIADVLEKVRRGDIPPPRQARADVPGALAAVCARAMALEPSDRYPSALALAADVEHWLADEPVSAHRDPLLVRAGRWARKHRTLVTTAAAVLLVVLTGLSLGLVVVGGLNRRLNDSNNKLEAALAEAETERNIAVAVNDFLQRDLLGQADIGNQRLPGDKAERDPNVTVAQLLDRAARAIEGKFKGQPQTEGAIRYTIGAAYRALGKYEEARPHLERSLAVREKELGADHPDTLTSMNDLAGLYHDQGKYEKAEPLYLEVLQEREKKLGADHLHTLTSKNNLALLYRDQGKYAEAEALFLEVLRRREEKLGADHPDTLTSKGSLASLYERWGKPEKAEPLLRQRQEFLQGKAGTGPAATAGAMAELGANLLRQKKHPEAEKLLRDCLLIREKTQPNEWTTCNTRSSLGEALLGQKKYAEARPLLLEGYVGLHKRAAKIPPPVRAVRLRQALQRLLQLAEATGKKDEAARWQKKLDELEKAASPPMPKK
jgi:eukaryotic-like serine/threonine-protein kinase